MERELEWWLKNRSVETTIILISDGEVVWSEGNRDFDWDQTTALSPGLRGAFHEEPLYVDLRWARSETKLSLRHARFRSAVLELAPRLYGKSREELDDEDVRQYRSMRRAAALGVCALAALSLAAGIAAYRANQERNLAVCRQLAGQAVSYLDDRLDLALLLGIESSRPANCVDGRSSLLTALQYRPHVTGFLHGHSDIVTNVAYSPDGRILASSSWDRSVRLWDIDNRKPLAPVLSGMYGLSFSPDGRLLASSDGETIAFWNIPSWTPSGELHADDGSLMSTVSFSPDGKTIAASVEPTGQVKAAILLWDVSTRKLLGPPLPARRFAFSPDGKTLATDDNHSYGIIIWDLHSRRPLGSPLVGHTRNVRCIAFSPDGQKLATGGEDNSIMIWNLRDRRRTGSALNGHRAPVNALAFDPAGTMLASGAGDRNIILWDVEKLRALGVPLAAANGPIFSLAFAPDGGTIVSNGGDHRLIIWGVAQDLPLGRVFEGPDFGDSNIAFNPNGQTLASIDGYGGVILSNVATGRPLRESIDRRVTSVRFSPDGSLLGTVSWDGLFALRDSGTGKAIGIPEKTNFRLWSIEFSADGRTVAAGGDSVILRWDTKVRRLLGAPILGQKDRIWSVAFSPDGRLLASAGNQSFGLWDARTGSPIMPPVVASTSSKYLVHADVSFSPNGKLLAVRDGENGAVLWDVANRRQVGPPLAGHKGLVTSLAFSPNGTLLATGALDGTTILWDLMTRQPLGRPFTGHGGEVWSLAFRPDGRALAVLGEKQIVLWDVSHDSWRDMACRIANRNLALGEWRQFFGSVPYHATCAGQSNTPGSH